MAVVANVPKTTFLDLPPELRTRIYKYAVVDIRRIWTYLEPHPTKADEGCYQIVPSLPAFASVCKAIRAEILPINYSENRFDLDHEGTGSLDYFCWTIKEWRRYLGNYSQDIRDLAVCNVVSRRDKNSSPVFREIYEVMEVTARFVTNGTMAFEREELAIKYCVCDLHKAAGELGCPRKDGRRLLDILEARCETQDMDLQEVLCDDCGLWKLDDFWRALNEDPDYNTEESSVTESEEESERD